MRKRQPLIRASSGADDIYERFYLNCCNGLVYELWVPGTVLRRFDLRHGSVTLPSLVCTAWCFISGRNDPVRHDRNESHHYARDVMLYLLIRSGSDCDRWSCREAWSGQRDIDVSHLRHRSLPSRQYFCSLTFSQSKIFTAFIKIWFILQLLKFSCASKVRPTVS